MKKVWSFTLAAALVISMLTGCGAQKQTEEKKDTAAQTQEQTENTAQTEPAVQSEEKMNKKNRER